LAAAQGGVARGMKGHISRIGTDLRISALSLLISAASSCARAPGTTCADWTPIYPTSHDAQVMSGQLAQQILEHNTHGERVCGWRIRAD
jgi:hypothetical protein